MRSYPHTFDNGHGEQLTFTSVTHGPRRARLEGEGVAQPGAGPPMHVHYLQDEAIRVVSGRLEMPTLVRRVVVPLVYAVGKYDKYRDAPPATTSNSRLDSARVAQPG